MLVVTANCECGGKSGKLSRSNPGGKKNGDQGGSNDQRTIKAIIIGPEEVVDEEPIDFKLKNEGDQAIDFKDLQAIIALSHQKDFNGEGIEERGGFSFQKKVD